MPETIEVRPCPHCHAAPRGAFVRVETRADGAMTVRRDPPRDGDLTVCGACGALLAFEEIAMCRITFGPPINVESTSRTFRRRPTTHADLRGIDPGAYSRIVEVQTVVMRAAAARLVAAMRAGEA